MYVFNFNRVTESSFSISISNDSNSIRNYDNVFPDFRFIVIIIIIMVLSDCDNSYLPTSRIFYIFFTLWSQIILHNSIYILLYCVIVILQ